MQNIPGRRSGPKGGEYRFSATSSSAYSWMNSAASPERGSRTSSHVSGKSFPSEFAKGQKPSRRPLTTESTNGRLGCEPRRNSNRSTLIGVTISKSSGCALIVSLATALSSSNWGGEGSGRNVSVRSAAGVTVRSSSSQRKPRKRLGLLLSLSGSGRFLVAFDGRVGF